MQLRGLGRNKLPQRGPGWSPVRKRILTHLRVSKRTSWQHFSASPNISYDAKRVSLPSFRRPCVYSISCAFNGIHGCGCRETDALDTMSCASAFTNFSKKKLVVRRREEEIFV